MMDNGLDPQAAGLRRPAPLFERLEAENRKAISYWQYILHHDTGVILDSLGPVAAQSIFTVAVNDAISLIDHVDRFDGRAAAHTSRSLFEHWMNICDVLKDDETAKRFNRHKFVTAQQVSSHDEWLQMLKPGQKRQEKRRLKKLGKSTKSHFDDAISDYGSKFHINWTGRTLKDRSDEHGATSNYESYRILSAVVHGSSGSLDRIVRDSGSTRTHVVGINYGSIPFAYIEGLNSFANLVMRVRQEVSLNEIDSFAVASGQLMNLLPQVYREVEKEDGKLRFNEAGPSIRRIAAVYPSGAINWYILNSTDQTAVRANPVGDVPDLSWAKDVLKRVNAISVSVDPILIDFEDIKLTARPGAAYGSWDGIRGREDFEFISQFVPNVAGAELVRR